MCPLPDHCDQCDQVWLARPQFLLSSYILTVLTVVSGQPQCLIMHAAFLNSPYTDAPLPLPPQYSQYSETSSALHGSTITQTQSTLGPLF